MAMQYTTPSGRKAVLVGGLEVEVSVEETTIRGVILNSGETAGPGGDEDWEPQSSFALLESWMRRYARDGASFVELEMNGRLPELLLPTNASLRVVSDDEKVNTILDEVGLHHAAPIDTTVPMTLVGDARFVGNDGETCHLAVLAIPHG